MLIANTCGKTTYSAKNFEILQYYYGTNSKIQNTDFVLGQLYFFLGKLDDWKPFENVSLTEKNMKDVYNNIFAYKKVGSSDISPIIERIDWVETTIYDIYSDSIDIMQKDDSGKLLYHFYVRNDLDQVFKCLWNNNGLESYVQPILEPGTQYYNNIIKTQDGYTWKYIYTISPGMKKKFFDSNWMPIPVTENRIWDSSYGIGSIDTINIVNGGSGYVNGSNTINITITGDGSNAKAISTVSSGSISDISMINVGKNYSYANIAITSVDGVSGNNGNAFASISPIGGHGFDLLSEFGCNHVMITGKFEFDESGTIPVDIEYKQLGLILNPFDNTSTLSYADDTTYFSSTKLLLSPGVGTFVSEDHVYQVDSSDNKIYTATVINFDESNNIINLINSKGTVQNNKSIYSNSAIRIVQQNIDHVDIIPYSGKILYVQNIDGISRSIDSSDNIRLILPY